MKNIKLEIYPPLVFIKFYCQIFLLNDTRQLTNVLVLGFTSLWIFVILIKFNGN